MRAVFAKPSIDELTAYAASIGFSGFDPEQFHDYYESCGWVVGRARKPMRNWQAAVRTWRRMRAEWAGAPTAARTPDSSAILDYAEQARAIIGAGGYEIGRFWRKVRDAIGPDGLARVQQLARAP
jgi:hypothetical protein